MSVDSRSLVPGDLLVVKDSWLLPCDLLILEGAVLSVLSHLLIWDKALGLGLLDHPKPSYMARKSFSWTCWP